MNQGPSNQELSNDISPNTSFINSCGVSPIRLPQGVPESSASVSTFTFFGSSKQNSAKLDLGSDGSVRSAEKPQQAKPMKESLKLFGKEESAKFPLSKELNPKALLKTIENHQVEIMGLKQKISSLECLLNKKDQQLIEQNSSLIKYQMSQDYEIIEVGGDAASKVHPSQLSLNPIQINEEIKRNSIDQAKLITELNSQINELATNLSFWKSQSETANKQNQELKERLQQQSSSLRVSEATANSLVQDKVKLTARVEVLQKEVKQLHTCNSQYENTIIELRDTNEIFASAFNVKNDAEMQKESALLEEMKKENKRLKEQNKLLQVELEKCQTELKNANDVSFESFLLGKLQSLEKKIKGDQQFSSEFDQILTRKVHDLVLKSARSIKESIQKYQIQFNYQLQC